MGTRYNAFLIGALPGIALLCFLSTRCGYKDDPRGYYEAAGLILGRPVHVGWIEAMHVGASVDNLPFKSLGPKLPYRDFHYEYPPLILPFFILPRLPSDKIEIFYRLFEIEMSLAGVGLGLCMCCIADRLGHALFSRRPLVCGLAWSLIMFAMGPAMVRRFDALPALAAGAALLAFLRARYGWCGLCVGIGAAFKLWPALLAPLFLIPLLLDRNFRGAVVMLCCSMAVPILSHVCLMPFVGMRVFDYLSYQKSRGIEIESLYSNLVTLVGWALQKPVRPYFEYGAFSIRTSPAGSPASQRGWADSVIAFSYLATMGGYAIVVGAAWRAMRRTRAGLERNVRLTAAVVAMIALLLLTSKVLSMQYLIWLCPAAFVLPGRAGLRILLWSYVALLLTVLEYKFGMDVKEHIMIRGTLLTPARNVAVAVIAVAAIRYLATPPSPENLEESLLPNFSGQAAK